MPERLVVCRELRGQRARERRVRLLQVLGAGADDAVGVQQSDDGRMRESAVGKLAVPDAEHGRDTAQIKVSFRHGAQRVVACRRLTPKEIAALPARERRPNDCSRARAPIVVQIVVDGKVLYDAVLEPTGLSGDGPAETYEKFVVPAGRHRLEARLRDGKRADGGFDYERVVDVDLAPFQNLAIDFKADQGGFLIR